MKPSKALASNRAAIRHVVESHRALNARVFGSVLRGQDTDTSDLDILIDPTPEMRNAVAHGYFKVDFEIVWRTIHRDLPGLHQQVCEFVDSPSNDDSGCTP